MLRRSLSDSYNTMASSSWRRVAAIMVALCVSCFSAALGQQTEVGDRVVLASPEVTLKIGKRVVADGLIHRVFTVGKIQGSWLWLESPDVSGWVKAASILPFDQALEQATENVQRESDSALARVALGLLWVDRGRADLAIEEYTKAIEIEPDWYVPRMNRGLAYQSAGRFDDALNDLNDAVERYRLDPLVYFNRGLVQLGRNDFRSACNDFELALEVDPEHTPSRFNRAALALALNRSGAAEDAEIYLAIAGWYESLSPYAALIASLDHQRNDQTDRATGLLEAAAAHLKDDQWPKPVFDYFQAKIDWEELLAQVETVDQEAEARAYAGRLLLQQGKADEAKPLFEWVLDRGDPTQIPNLLARSGLAEVDAN